MWYIDLETEALHHLSMSLDMSIGWSVQHASNCYSPISWQRWSRNMVVNVYVLLWGDRHQTRSSSWNSHTPTSHFRTHSQRSCSRPIKYKGKRWSTGRGLYKMPSATWLDTFHDHCIRLGKTLRAFMNSLISTTYKRRKTYNDRKLVLRSRLYKCIDQKPYHISPYGYTQRWHEQYRRQRQSQLYKQQSISRMDII